MVLIDDVMLYNVIIVVDSNDVISRRGQEIPVNNYVVSTNFVVF